MGSIRCSDTIYKLSAGRRTIVRWLANDRPPASERSFAARRTTSESKHQP
ncbi:MAG TPA: hypothetical protein K8W09_05285 [Parabacteroides johnsonii]|nr:hypothetical protein [Parabacteroides johnsonii]MBV4244428.1 hypothetical protein [Parabacteroides johnsonii]UEA89697.1 hypothetical protein LK449_14235 [Parabacteroides johnsonii]UWP41859.1 hypothetical protein NQ564_13205 [Parabacteroides johnsonii DSM 18315]HJG98673.1 hypothetical protein [Parabacteroides johnsonii]